MNETDEYKYSQKHKQQERMERVIAERWKEKRTWIELVLLIGLAMANKKYIIMFNVPEDGGLERMQAQSDDHIRRISSKYFGKQDRIVGARMLNGVQAELSEKTRERVEKDPAVAVVEEDKLMRIAVNIKGVEGASRWPGSTGKTTGKVAYIRRTPSLNGGTGSGRMRRLMVRAGRLPSLMPLYTELKPPNRANRVKKMGRSQSGHAISGKTAGRMRDRSSGSSTMEILDFVVQSDAPWGLARISGSDGGYEYIDQGGKHVNAYVLDTGIDIGHPEFEGRAAWGYNAVTGSPDEDENGHGTHCAGTIAGKTFGVAKGATVIAVKVLNKEGEGMVSNMIGGIEFVIKDHQRRIEAFLERKAEARGLKKGPADLLRSIRELLAKSEDSPWAVVNLSLGGAKSVALNFAIHYANKFMGVHFATAAGNDHENACGFSPASAYNAITVGASDPSDHIATFSNVGDCVDLYAPGVEIESAWPGGGTKTISGTSMASPHVVGVIALYLGLYPFSMEGLPLRILNDAEEAVTEPAVDEEDIPTVKLPLVSLRKLHDRLKRQ